MKYFTILCLYVVLVQSKLNPEVIRDWNNLQARYIDVCSKEANLDPKIPPIILKKLYTPDEPNFHCYLKCILKSNNLMQADDNLDVAKIAEVIHMTPEIASQCVKAAEYEANLCRKVYLVAICCMKSKFEV